MHREYSMVREFHRKFAHPVAEKPQQLENARARQRATWMREEVEEFLHAGDKWEQSRELVDVIYFALGTLVEMGVDPTDVFAAVHRANMSKLGANGEVELEEDGKVKKPQTWQDPIAEIRRLFD